MPAGTADDSTKYGNCFCLSAFRLAATTESRCNALGDHGTETTKHKRAPPTW